MGISGCMEGCLLSGAFAVLVASWQAVQVGEHGLLTAHGEKEICDGCEPLQRCPADRREWDMGIWFGFGFCFGLPQARW